ncbi:MAG: D-aminoacyl-tRNA deacylase [Planctomycetota bacterium]|nr:D-aminoacyl-tRNA deacylase [Planctomycetota bacterium]
MRTVLQRVSRAAVRVDGEEVGAIETGVLLLVGVERGDTEADADATVRKIAGLRVFPGRTPMDRTLAEVGGGCLVVSQFTLLGTVKKGNRPGFDKAAEPALAERLYERVAAGLAATGLPVATGVFGASMQVELVNEGPVTLRIETQDGRILP